MLRRALLTWFGLAVSACGPSPTDLGNLGGQSPTLGSPVFDGTPMLSVGDTVYWVGDTLTVSDGTDTYRLERGDSSGDYGEVYLNGVLKSIWEELPSIGGVARIRVTEASSGSFYDVLADSTFYAWGQVGCLEEVTEYDPEEDYKCPGGPVFIDPVCVDLVVGPDVLGEVDGGFEEKCVGGRSAARVVRHWEEVGRAPTVYHGGCEERLDFAPMASSEDCSQYWEAAGERALEVAGTAFFSWRMGGPSNPIGQAFAAAAAFSVVRLGIEIGFGVHCALTQD